MEFLKLACRRIKALFTGAVMEREMDNEMHLHLDLLTEQYELSGMPHEEAKRAARRRFGNLPHIKERSRDIRGPGILDDLLRDVQYAARKFRKTPIFTAVILLSLALGIGVNAALFSAFDAELFRKLSVDKPDQLVFFKWASRNWSPACALLF